MRFSLILATINRTDELSRFLQSLDMQSYRAFELIVVDQNADDRVQPILAFFQQKFPICHLRSQPGVSRARNLGLRHMCGDVVAFPDDDCWYPPHFLERAAQLLREHPEWDGLTGRSRDEHGRETILRAHPTPGIVTRYNIWWRVCAIAIFLRRHVIEAIQGFDETLGPGAGTPWGGLEDLELVLRAVETGFRIFYHPDNVAGHADPVASYPPSSWRRSYAYNCGLGRVLRKHRLPPWFVLYQWARPLCGMSISLLRGNVPKATFHWYAFRGRLDGWLGMPRDARVGE